MNRLLSGTRARVLLVTLLSGVLGVTGLGAMPPASAAPQGSIAGTVTDADGAGIKGIEVTAYEFDGVDTWAFVASTTTKKNGTYSLKKLPAADYTVEFADDDSTYVSEFYDDRRLIELADGVPVAQGQAVVNIDAQLARTGTIRGTVTDEQGQPLPGIFIDILTVDEDGIPTGSPDGGTTNDAGVYVVPFIAPGDYVVGFTDLDGTYVTEYYNDHLNVVDSDLVTVTPAGVTAEIDAKLALGGHISGTVTDSGGDPIPDIEIDLARLVDGEWWSFGEEFGFHTQDDGTYQIDGLPAGTWQIGFFDSERNYLGEYYDNQPTFETATTLDLAPGGTRSGIDASLDAASHIQGTVTDEADGPLGGIFVTAWAREGDHWAIFGDTETEADGSYSIDGLRADDYRVRFQSQGEYADEYFDNVLSIEDATPVDPGAGETVTSIDAQLAPAAHITGEITDTSGTGLQGAVFAWRQHGSTWDDVGFAFTEDGSYDVGSLSPGTYRLEFLTLDGIDAHEFWDDQPSLELAGNVVVTDEGEVLTGYDAVLEDGQYPSDVENLTSPAISGSAAVGQTLTASPGTWNLGATTFHYQWFAGTTPVGTDTATYAPQAADVGKKITVTVVGTVVGLGSAAATSAATAAVTGASAPPPPPPPGAKQVANLKLPVIKGILEVGRRARVTTGLWSPAAVDLTYKWLVGGKRIAKSDKRKLVLKEKWVGKRLRVVVVAKADGYLAVRVVTQRSAKIKS